MISENMKKRNRILLICEHSAEIKPRQAAGQPAKEGK